MKTILCIISLFFVVRGNSQTSYITGDFSVGGASVSEYHFINPGFYHTLGNKEKVGLFTEAVLEPGVWSIAPGIFFVSKKGTFYHEYGGGPGFEYEGKDHRVYANAYYYGESYNGDLHKGKFVISINLSYSKEWEESLWRQVVVVVYPCNKWLGVGIHSQSYAADGFRIQTALGKKGVCTPYAVVGIHSRFQIGLLFSSLVHKRK